MQVSEFQIESRLLCLDNTSHTQVNHWLNTESHGPRLETVMLGLRWRGRLSDHDRNLLDWLFSEPQVVFLKRGNEYLHPEGVPLLPDGTLEVPPLQNRESIFTQRVTIPKRRFGSDALLRAARLSRADEPELILGTLGCEDEAARQAADDRFGTLVTEFRDAWETAGRIETTLRGRLDETQPYLIVCRASGRLVAASESMAARLGEPGDSLAGREYTEFAARLTADLEGVALSLENTQIEGIYLSLASLKPRPGAAAPSADGSLSEHFIHTMKNKLSCIVAASTHLSGVLATSDDAAELLDIIAAESAGLGDYLDRLQLLGSASTQGGVETGIMDALKAAVENLTPPQGRTPEVEFRGVRTSRTVSMVPQALPMMFDAVLRTHRLTHRAHEHTTIGVCENDRRTEVTVSTKWADGNGVSTPDIHWQRFAARLAESLNLKYSSRPPDQPGGAVSIIEITHQGDDTDHDR